MAILSRDLLAGPHADELMSVLARTGEKGASFVWEHKGALASATVMAAFLTNPEPFIDGTRDLAETVVEGGAKAVDSVATHVVGPVVTEVSREAARTIPWGPLSILTVLVAGGVGSLAVFRRRPAREPAK
jgi:hypothetical protein